MHRNWGRKWGLAGLVFGAAMWPGGAGASGDGGCEPSWQLAAPVLDCVNRIVIGPGNDTRVNLMLLLRDRAGLAGAGPDYRDDLWLGDYYGHTFFDWDQLVAVTRPIYRDMKLTHYNGNSFNANPQNLFHWALIRDEVAKDVDVAKR